MSQPPFFSIDFIENFFVNLVYKTQAVASEGAGGALAPQFLAKQLILSQPGGQILPTTVLRAPPGISDLATGLRLNEQPT